MSHEVLTSNNTIDDRRNEMFLSVTQNKNLIHILPLNHCAPANLYSISALITVWSQGLFIHFMTNQNERTEVNEVCTFCQFYFLRRMDISHNSLC